MFNISIDFELMRERTADLIFDTAEKVAVALDSILESVEDFANGFTDD